MSYRALYAIALISIVLLFTASTVLAVTSDPIVSISCPTSNSTSSSVCTCLPTTGHVELYNSGTACRLVQRCSSDFNSTAAKCSGHGTCLNRMHDQYCVCNPGWAGVYCNVSTSTERPDLNPCDCGVSWSSAVHSFQTVSPLNVKVVMIRAGPVIATDAIFFAQDGDVNDPRIADQLSVGHMGQAKFICYSTIGCDGFFTTKVGTTDVVGFFSFQTDQHNIGVWQSIVAASVWTITRAANYRCAGGAFLDSAFYQREHMPEIIADCERMIRTGVPSEFNLPLTPNSDANACRIDSRVRSMWTDLHWQHRGHVRRYSPNQACLLQPTIYDPAMMCATARKGCIGFPNPLTNEPCSGQGYCVPSNTTNDPLGDFACLCHVVAGTVSSGITLAGQPKYIGRACQYDIASGCTGAFGTTSGIQAYYCNGHVDRCYADAVWNGLGAFNDPTNTDFKPSCHCARDDTNPLPVFGAYCEQDRCGDDTLRCNSLRDPTNVCTRTAIVDTQSVTVPNHIYQCSCGDQWIGPQCTFSAHACLYNGRKCSGRGNCVPGAGSNYSSPHCECSSSTYFGSLCENQLCPESVMAPGHGECSNNALVRCYDVYRGASCQFDVCAQSNGTVIPPNLLLGETEPTKCLCPTGYAATFASQGDPSCWPICGGTQSGVECGGGGVCQQIESSGRRTASCICSAGYIRVDDAQNRTTCEKYCRHGDFDPTKTWDTRNPPTCLCDGTGFNTLNNHPRCDNPVCQNRGTYNNVTHLCACERPFTSITSCTTDTCNALPRPESYTKGVVGNTTVNGRPSYACFCNKPFGRISDLQPFDCDANYCGSHGIQNLVWSTAMPVIAMCTCIGPWRSTFTSFTDIRTYGFCSVQTCENGGFPSNLDKTTCVCPFPYTNGALKRCEANLCNIQHSTGSNANGCLCMTGYGGPTCSDVVTISQVRSSSSSSSTGGIRISSSSSSSASWFVPTIQLSSSGGGGIGFNISSGTSRYYNPLFGFAFYATLCITVYFFFLFTRH